jgi:hypothetical protein
MPLVDGCLFVDNSMLELLTTCPRQLEYNKLFARVAAAEKPSLNFGSAIHDALEFRYVHGEAIDPYVEQDQLTILNDSFARRPTPEDDWRNVNWAAELMRKYNELHRLEPFNLLQYDTPIVCPRCQGADGIINAKNEAMQCLWCAGTKVRKTMVELPFALELFTLPRRMSERSWVTEADRKHVERHDGIPVMYSGRIDLPVFWDGGLFVMDHKTTSMLGSSFFERASMSAQQRGYCWAFNKLTGHKVHGYCINALRTKEPPQYIFNPTKAVPKGQSPEKWWGESFQREKFYTTPDAIEEWRQNTIELIHEFVWHYSRDVMPMKTAWCTQFGRCQYYDVCSLPRESRHLMLTSGNYTDNTWNPLREPSQAKQ